MTELSEPMVTKQEQAFLLVPASMATYSDKKNSRTVSCFCPFTYIPVTRERVVYLVRPL